METNETLKAHQHFEEGILSFTGISRKFSLQDAAVHFQAAAGLRHVEASAYLAFCFSLLVPTDQTLIPKYAKFAADQGNVLGHSVFAWCLETGIGIQRDQFRAVRLYLEAINLARERNHLDFGYADANENLARCYTQGLGVQVNIKKSEECLVELFRWANMEGKNGNIIAAGILGYLYHNGQGIEASENESKKWTELAIANGHPIAQNWFAFRLIEQDGFSNIFVKDLLLKAAEQNYRHSFFTLGNYFWYFGDKESAYLWFEKAVNANDIYALNDLGYLFETEDRLKAQEYFWKAKQLEKSLDFSVSQISSINASVDLGIDILDSIFKLLDISTIWAVSKTCITWRRICEMSDQRIWRCAFFNTFYRRFFSINLFHLSKIHDDFIHVDIANLLKSWIVPIKKEVTLGSRMDEILNLDDFAPYSTFQNAALLIPNFRKLIEAGLDGWKAFSLFRFYALNELTRITKINKKQRALLEEVVDHKTDKPRASDIKKELIEFFDIVCECNNALNVSLLIDKPGACCVKTFFRNLDDVEKDAFVVLFSSKPQSAPGFVLMQNHVSEDEKCLKILRCTGDIVDAERRIEFLDCTDEGFQAFAEEYLDEPYNTLNTRFEEFDFCFTKY
ncbi:hypothetical protein HK096_008375 [Nowakowskiella sp. JEL0078]|nr:hypothetical protein HK096_008375 [Nowakowskiella sp. JEL0078]